MDKTESSTVSRCTHNAVYTSYLENQGDESLSSIIDNHPSKWLVALVNSLTYSSSVFLPMHRIAHLGRYR
jgi:hypothetical protein